VRHTGRLVGPVLIALPVLLFGCGDSSTLFGEPGTTGGGAGGATGGGGTASSSSGDGGTTSTSGVGGAGGSTGGSGGTSCTPVGHDEEQDTVDDACDNCPSYGNDTQGDGDQDGLGDACEAPGDPALWSTVASFEPFVAPPTGWDLGDFSHGSDVLQINTPFNAGRNADWLTPQAGNYSVETSFAYQGNVGAWAGVRFAINGPSWWACLVQRSMTTGGIRYDLGLWEYPGTGNNVLLRAESEDVGADPVGLARRVRVHVRPGGNLLCTYDDAANQQGQVEYQAGNADGLVGLRAYDTHVHFFNFVTYQ